MVEASSQSNNGVRRSIIWVVTAHSSTIMSQLAILLVLTNLGEQLMVGQWAYAIAIVTPIFLLAGLGVRQARASDVQHNHRFGDYFRVRVASIAAALGIVAIIIAVIDISQQQALIILLMALIRACENLYELVYGDYQLHGRHKLVGQSAFLIGTISFLFFALGFLLTDLLAVAMLMQLIGVLSVLIFFDRRHNRRLNVGDQQGTGETPTDRQQSADNKSPIRQIILAGLPLGFSAVLIWLQPNVTRFMVEYFEGIEQLGYFTVLLYAYTASQMLIVAIGHGAVTQMANLYHNSATRSFVSLVIKLSLFVGGLGGAAIFVTWLIGKDVLSIMFGSDYAAFHGVLIAIVVGSSLRYIGGIIQFAVVATGAFQAIMKVHIATASVAVLAALYLIDLMGLMGAAFAIIIVNATHLVLILGVFFMLVARNDSKTGEEKL